MASPAAVITALFAKIVSNTSIDARADSPLSRDFAIPTGETHVHGPVLIDEFDREIDPNDTYRTLRAELEICHHLLDPTDASTYLDGDYVTDSLALLDHDFYETIAGVYDVVDDPELSDDPEPVGNVIVYSVTVRFRIDPD